MKYNNGTDSSIGSQIYTYAYDKKAIKETMDDVVFTRLSDTKDMPKHLGKEIKSFYYLPIIDNRNIGDEGIDASGATTVKAVTIQVGSTGGSGNLQPGQLHVKDVKGEGADDAAALLDAQNKALDIFKEMGLFDTDYATSKAAAIAAGNFVNESPAYVAAGNLYGSSKDVGTIGNNMPELTEEGGQVNKVSMTRIDVSGSIKFYGFYMDYTAESMNFDNDAELEMHMREKMVEAATRVNEDLIQKDLLNNAGITYLAGDATSVSEISAEGAVIDEVSYESLTRLSKELKDARAPRKTKIITGSRMVDTKTVDSGWVMFIGTDLEQSVRRMTNYHGDAALIDVKHYAHKESEVIPGEIGTIDNFRIVVVDRMMKWEGAGAAVTANPGYQETNGNYDVFPMLVVADDAFTTLGFMTGNNKGHKFKITHKKPGAEIADLQNPYGTKGFISIQWYYGTLIKRPERIALIKTVARR